MQAAGVCLGWDVRASQQLLFTRRSEDDARPVLEVVVSDVAPPPASHDVILEWVADEINPVAARIHRSPDRAVFHVYIEGGGWFRVEPTVPRITAPSGAEPVRREERLWGLPAQLCLLARGDLPLHAAAFEVGGRAVLVAGPSRAGKTTLAAGAFGDGWRVLAEDLAAVSLAHTPPVVHAGPTYLRVREDVLERLGRLPSSRSWSLGDGRVHVALESDRAAPAVAFPIAAVCLLHWADRPGLTSLDTASALRDLWAVAFRIPDTEDRVRCLDQLTELVDTVPVLRLERPMDDSGMRASLRLLKEVASDA